VPEEPLDPAIVDRVRRRLIEEGASADEVDAALAAGRLELLVLDRVALPGPGTYTPADLASRADLPLDLADRLWVALGFPSVPADEAAFGDHDLAALVTLRQLIELGVTDGGTSVQFARTIGSAMARIAEAEVSAQPVQHPSESARVVFADALLSGADEFFDRMTELLAYVYRRHLHAAARRAAFADRVDKVGTMATVAVGFADLVGYTALSSQLSDDALGQLVSRFEELARDAVTAGGGRVVKMIGDEVMFVVEDVAAAARVALALADVFADDDILSDVRVGLACGHVLSQEGDYYGAVVNLASRLVNVAYPSTVVVSQAVHDALEDDDELAWRSLRSRHLKDLGSVPLWVLSRAGEELRTGRRRFRPLRTLLSEAGFQRAERHL
jgi:adenylate cyclase